MKPWTLLSLPITALALFDWFHVERWLPSGPWLASDLEQISRDDLATDPIGKKPDNPKRGGMETCLRGLERALKECQVEKPSERSWIQRVQTLLTEGPSMMGGAKESVKEGAVKVKEGVKEGLQAAKESVKESVQDTYIAAKDTAKAAKERTKDTYNAAKDTVNTAKERTMETVNAAREKTRKAAKHVRDWVVPETASEDEDYDEEDDFEDIYRDKGVMAAIAHLFHPLVDLGMHVRTDPNAYIIAVDVPGCRPEDLRVHVEGHVLVVRGRARHCMHQDENQESGEEYFGSEGEVCWHRNIERTLALPRDAHPVNAKTGRVLGEAVASQGTLLIRIPRANAGVYKGLVDIPVHEEEQAHPSWFRRLLRR